MAEKHATGRPIDPPRIITAGEVYSNDVDIYLDGVLEKGPPYYIHVNTETGSAIKYVQARPNSSAFGTEIVNGNFEIKWKPDDRS